MPNPATAVPPGRPTRVFRALFACFEPRSVPGTHVAKGTGWHAGPSLAALARPISSALPFAASDVPGQPGCPPPGTRA